jgi:hypothetical protein
MGMYPIAVSAERKVRKSFFASGRLDGFFAALVFVLLAAFVIVSAIGLVAQNALPAEQTLPFIALLALSFAFGVWFIACFTGDIDEETRLEADRRRRQGFRFAYVFTLTSLVVLVLPVTNPWQPDLIGPISLIRGCVDAQRDATVPASVRCGVDDLTGPETDGKAHRASSQASIPAEPKSGAAATGEKGATKNSVASHGGAHTQKPAQPARAAARSKPQPTDTLGKDKDATMDVASSTSAVTAGSGADAASAASEAAVIEAHASASKSAGGGGPFFRQFIRHGGYLYEPSYPWLVVIGGTYGYAADVDERGWNQDAAAGKDTAQGSAPGASNAASSPTGNPRLGETQPASSAENQSDTWTRFKTWCSGLIPTRVARPDALRQNLMPQSRRPYQIIEGGFVVPYYIVLLAFLGAAIGLSRRIPEYQKRSEPLYIGTAEQPPLDARTVREQVIFQIMQLITAPFIAMVAFYAIAPNSVATGIALGFISGFASELVLLQIRSVAEGLFPKSSAKIAETSVKTGVVRGFVYKWGTLTADDEPSIATSSAKRSGWRFWRPDGVQPRVDEHSPGDPICGVEVVVRDRPKLRDTTNSSGEFAICGVPIGQQVLKASHNGLSGLAIVTVCPAAETRRDIALGSKQKTEPIVGKQESGQKDETKAPGTDSSKDGSGAS